MISRHLLHLSQPNQWQRGWKTFFKKGGSLALRDFLKSSGFPTHLSACPSSCVPDWPSRDGRSVDSLHRYVKNAKLDKDQNSGHTESHKDVQCLEVEGALGWMEEEEDGGKGEGARGWREQRQGVNQVLHVWAREKGGRAQRRRQVWRGYLISGWNEEMKIWIKRGKMGTCGVQMKVPISQLCQSIFFTLVKCELLLNFGYCSSWTKIRDEREICCFWYLDSEGSKWTAHIFSAVWWTLLLFLRWQQLTIMIPDKSKGNRIMMNRATKKRYSLLREGIDLFNMLQNESPEIILHFIEARFFSTGHFYFYLRTEPEFPPQIPQIVHILHDSGIYLLF